MSKRIKKVLVEDDISTTEVNEEISEIIDVEDEHELTINETEVTLDTSLTEFPSVFDNGVIRPMTQEEYENHIFILNNPIKIVPDSVSMAQARLILLKIGKLSEVDSAINNMIGDEGESARIEWEFQTRVSRKSNLVMEMANMLELTDEELDDLFIEASKI